MNRAFKIQFHNGEKDEKTIVTLSCTVNNGKRFKSLDDYGKKCLLENIQTFKRSLEGFENDIKSNMASK